MGLGKSLTGLGLKKFKKPWAWARQKNAQPLYCTKKNVEISIFTTKKCRNLHFPNKKKDRKIYSDTNQQTLTSNPKTLRPFF